MYIRFSYSCFSLVKNVPPVKLCRYMSNTLFVPSKHPNIRSRSIPRSDTLKTRRLGARCKRSSEAQEKISCRFVLPFLPHPMFLFREATNTTWWVPWVPFSSLALAFFLLFFHAARTYDVSAAARALQPSGIANSYWRFIQEWKLGSAPISAFGHYLRRFQPPVIIS